MPSQAQLKEIEQLQLLLIEEQTDMISSLEAIKAQGILLLERVKALQDNQVTPELEAAVQAVKTSAVKVDQKVPDAPPPIPSPSSTGGTPAQFT
jgi:hypothetical protein